MPPHVSVDFQITSGGVERAIGFTDTDTKLPIIGRIENVVADGKWHHAELNLKRMLDTGVRDFSKSVYSISQFLIGDWGYAANPPGVSYSLDNVRAVPAVSSAQGLELAWSARDASGIGAYSYTWSRIRGDVPDLVSEGAATTARFDRVPEGRQYFHIRAQDKAGNWGEPVHYPFVVDNTPPKLVSAEPAADAGAASPEIAIRFDEQGAGLDPSALSLQLNGRHYSLSSLHTKFDPVQGVLKWNWVSAMGAKTEPKPIDDGTEMKFALSRVRDVVGNACEPAEWAWRIDYTKDKVGPRAPDVRCKSASPASFDSFTSHLGNWRPYGQRATAAQLSRHFDEERQGSCLRLYHERRGGSFGAYIVYSKEGTYDAQNYPIIAFDYKMPKGVVLMFIVYVNRTWYGVKITELSRYTNIGEVANIKADGKWRHAWFNLYEMLEKVDPDIEDFTVRYLAIGDWGKYANPAGAEYFVDNFAIMGEGPPFPDFKWYAADATGIAEYSWHLDDKPYSTPDTTPEPFEKDKLEFAMVGTPGMSYFHVRARDGAGNWGKPAHYPYFCTGVRKPTREDGLEAVTAWKPAGKKRTQVSVLTQNVGEKDNKILRISFRSSRSHEVKLTFESPLDLSEKKRVSFAVYNGVSRYLRIALVVRTHRGITDALLRALGKEVPAEAMKQLGEMKGQTFATRDALEQALKTVLPGDQSAAHRELILSRAEKMTSFESEPVTISSRRWQEDVTFDLNAAAYRADSNTYQYAVRLENRSAVREIGLVVQNQWSRGYVLIDGMRVE